MYLDDADDIKRVEEPRLFVGVLAVSAAFIILIGVYPEPIISFVMRVASGL